MPKPDQRALNAYKDWFDDCFERGLRDIERLSPKDLMAGVALYCAAFPDTVADKLRDSDASDLIAGAAPAYFEAQAEERVSAPLVARTIASFAITVMRDLATAEITAHWEGRLGEWFADAPNRRRDEADDARYETYRDQKMLEAMP